MQMSEINETIETELKEAGTVASKENLTADANMDKVLEEGDTEENPFFAKNWMSIE